MDILHQIPTETKIKAELKKVLFGKILFCPHCGCKLVKRSEKRYRCKLCRKPFSFTSVCWLSGMKIPLKTLWLLLWCWTNKVPVDQTRKVCGLSEPTVRKWFEKFRNHLPYNKLSEIRLSGIVQMDEFYRGGKKKGYAIIGAKQQAQPNQERKMVMQVIPKPSVDRTDTLDFLHQNVEPLSQLQTDGAAIYRGIGNWWPVNHKYEIHKRWEFALRSEAEGMWGNFATFVRRMYHHTTKNKIAGIAQEFTARQMFPEWFANPQSFLKVSLNRVVKIERKPGKPRKEIFSPETVNFSMSDLINNIAYVPSC